MKFKYRYKVQPSDLWQFHMYYAYSSYLCIINIVCIISSLALIIKLWANSPSWFRAVLILFLSLFTVIQPLAIYFRSCAQASASQDEIELTFYEGGIRACVNGETQEKKWEDILQIVKKPTMSVIYTDMEHGYLLTDRVVKDSKKDFMDFLDRKRLARG